MRYFNMIDLTQLYDLTPRQWNSLVEGHQYRQIDRQRFAVEEAYLFANANNGKKLTSYISALDVRESKIGKTEEEIKHDENYQKALLEKQKADMALWMQSLNQNNKEG